MKKIIVIIGLLITVLGLTFGFSQVTQQQTDSYWSGTATGTDTYTVTISKITATSPYNFQTITVNFTNANTGAATLRVIISGGAAYTARGITLNGSNLAAGDIKAGVNTILKYNTSTSKWQLQPYTSTTGPGIFTAATLTTTIGVTDTVLFKSGTTTYKTTRNGFNQVQGNQTYTVTGHRNEYLTGNDTYGTGGTLEWNIGNTANLNFSNTLNTIVTGASTFSSSATYTIGSPTVSVSGKLGVGTATPGQPLHVVGTDNLFSTYTAKFRSADNSKGIDIANNGVLFINTSTYNAVGINMEGSAWIKSTGSDMLDLMKSNNQYAFAFQDDDRLAIYRGGSVVSCIEDGFLGINIGIGAPSAPFHLVSTGSVTATFAQLNYNSNGDTLLFLENNGKVYFGEYGTNSTAGDAATINQPKGSFIKDVTGSTFTLTNSLITSKSKIFLQVTTAGLTTGNEVIPVVADGSCTITFQTSLVGAAPPSANATVNFWVVQ